MELTTWILDFIKDWWAISVLLITNYMLWKKLDSKEQTLLELVKTLEETNQTQRELGTAIKDVNTIILDYLIKK